MPAIPSKLQQFWQPFLGKYTSKIETMLTHLGHKPDAMIGIVFVTEALYENRKAAGGCILLSEPDMEAVRRDWPRVPDPHFWSPNASRPIGVIVPLLPPGKSPPA